MQIIKLTVTKNNVVNAFCPPNSRFTKLFKKRQSCSHGKFFPPEGVSYYAEKFAFVVLDSERRRTIFTVLFSFRLFLFFVFLPYERFNYMRNITVLLVMFKQPINEFISLLIIGFKFHSTFYGPSVNDFKNLFLCGF